VRELPSGTVTFVFTDIEGSTKLLHELGDAYADALAEHRRLLRTAFDQHGGFEVDTQGDAFFVAFERARDALAAARDAQAALAGGPIRVRMGLHTGEPLVTEEGYVGLDVHRAARIAAVGHGGQVLVSQSTRELVEEGLLALGEHRLKDFAEPVALYQLGATAFPPLKTLSNTNLPRPASSFVGRERDVEEILGRVRDGARLLTLTGAGGSGKTRLAIEAAAELVPELTAGVFWVGLGAIRDPARVADTIGHTLGATNGLAAHIGQQELLLLVDNFEHVIGAAPELASLLEACPNLKLLVTSRELLRVRGEIEYPVLPLAHGEAAALFCQRSALDRNETIDQLCQALDKLPLAIELAAARTRILSPRQILERLSERLDLFKGGRDAEARQQTLRATIDWSYELLEPEEQRLFARFAIFSRGCTLEAAAEVADADLDALQSLADKNLIRHTDERFWMLQTIQESAAERLRESGELAELAREHARYFHAFVEQAEAKLAGSNQRQWLRRVEEELDNVRGAVHRSLDDGECDQALSIVVALERFWSAHGRADEAFSLIESILGLCGGSVDRELRARALFVAGLNAVRLRRLEQADRLYQAALELFLELGRRDAEVRCRAELATLHQESGREAQATQFAAHALATAKAINETGPLAVATHCLALIADDRGEYSDAVALHQQSLRLWRELGDSARIASSLYHLGLAARGLGDIDLAERAFAEALEVASDADHAVLAAASSLNLGYVVLFRGDHPRARMLAARGVRLFREIGDARWMAEGVNLVASIVAAEGDSRTAALLWGAVDAALADAHTSLDAIDAQARELFEPDAHRSLGPAGFEAAANEGQRLRVEQAIDVASSSLSAGPWAGDAVDQA
jgi:predicted ATPase